MARVAEPIVDSHVHYWDPAARHHDWLADVPPLNRRFGPEDIDYGRHEVRAQVFVQADARDEEALDEARWVARLADADSRIRGIVAFAPLQLGADVASHLDALGREPLVKGVRRLLQDEPVEAITDPAFLAGVRLLAQRDLSFDICVRHAQLPAVARLVEACPETRFVLDHVGKPPVAAGILDPWREQLASVASRPNVVCKLSGLSSEAASDWQDADVAPYLEHALEVFGPSRCMVGSDWPVATLQTTLERWFDLVLAVLEPLTADDRAAVLAGTAERFYRLAT
jgi:L-fuconolactonase